MQTHQKTDLCCTGLCQKIAQPSEISQIPPSQIPPRSRILGGKNSMDAIVGQNERGHDRRQREGIIKRPPFVANSIKIAALDHAESYQQLFSSTGILLDDGLDLSARTHNQLGSATQQSTTTEEFPVVQTGREESGNQVRFRVVRGLLLVDLTRLLEAILYLEDLLISSQDRNWIAQTIIVAGTQFMISNASTKRFLNDHLHPRWAFLIQSVTFPIALYQILNGELQVRSTIAVRRGLEELYARVKNGEAIDQTVLKCITGSLWSRVPWSKIE